MNKKDKSAVERTLTFCVMYGTLPIVCEICDEIAGRIREWKNNRIRNEIQKEFERIVNSRS